MSPAEEQIQAFFKGIATKWFKEDDKTNRYNQHFHQENFFLIFCVIKNGTVDCSRSLHPFETTYSVLVVGSSRYV
jgi:hypothetical protein